MEITDKLNNRVWVLAFAKLVRQGCKLFQQNFNFFWKEYGVPLDRGPRAEGPLAPL